MEMPRSTSNRASLLIAEKYLHLFLAALFVLWSHTAIAEADGIYDDIQVLAPSGSTGRTPSPLSTDDGKTVTPENNVIVSNPNDETFMWQLRAKQIYSSSAWGYKIPVLEEQDNEMQRTAGWQRRNIYIPTRTYMAVGDEVTVTVKSYPSLTTTCSANTFKDFDASYTPSQINQLVLRKNTSQVYRATIPGLLMLACVDTDKDMSNWTSFNKFVEISTSPPAKSSSLYIYGVTSPSQWSDIAQNPDPSGHVFLFNGRTVFDFPADVARAHASRNINAMMHEHLVITSSYDHLNGLNFSTVKPSSLERPSLSMYQASFNTCCSSSYSNGRISINFGGERINSFWGDWHEYGHQNQPAWKWGQLIEISVNLFSFEACQTLTGKSIEILERCSYFGSFVTSDPEAVGRFLAMDGLPYIPADENEANNKILLMLAQLYTSFPDWHAQLAKDFRVAYARGANANNFSTDAKKINWFVIQSSRIVGRDLREFFDKWRLTYSAAARQAIINLDLPQPIKPTVQYLTEWNVSQAPTLRGIITVPPLINTVGLVAYGRDEGPTMIIYHPEETFTKLTTMIVGTKRVPYTLVLRGTLKHGSCPDEYPINAAVSCISDDRSNYWTLSYSPEDNSMALPVDNYEGVLRLGIRSAHNREWGGTLTVPIKFDVTGN